jgi:integrase
LSLSILAKGSNRVSGKTNGFWNTKTLYWILRGVAMKKGAQRRRTDYPGVYVRQSEQRRHKNKPDTCFDISYKKQGRKIWEKVGWASEGYSAKVASQVRAERLRMIRHGQELPKEKARIPRFSEMADLYLEWAKENKSRNRDDKSRYEKHLKDRLGNRRLNEIPSFELERLKSELTKKGLAPATVKHCLVLVREIFNKAVEWGKYWGPNPIKGVKLPTLNNRRERFLHCGLRAGEIFNLRGQDIDLDNGLIRIMDPKNKASRAAYMTEAVKRMLKARLPKDPNEIIFKDRWHGEKIELVSRTFQRAVDKLGLNRGVEDIRQKVVFHSLRHTFASWLAIQGTPILAIRDLLGHKTLAMTERYAHLIPDMKKQAISQLEGRFEAGRKNSKVIPMAAAKETPGNKLGRPDPMSGGIQGDDLHPLE